MHFAKKKESKYHDIDSFSPHYFSLTKSKVIMKSIKRVSNSKLLSIIVNPFTPRSYLILVILTTVCHILD